MMEGLDVNYNGATKMAILGGVFLNHHRGLGIIFVE